MEEVILDNPGGLTKVLIWRRQEVSPRDLKMLCYWLQGWRKGQGAKGCGQPLEAGKNKECGLAESLLREHSPADTLIFALLDPFQTSDLQHYEIRNLCCFRPPRL